MIKYRVSGREYSVDEKYVKACTKAVTGHLNAARERSEALGTGTDYYLAYILVLYTTTRAILDQMGSDNIMRLTADYLKGKEKG